MRTAVIGLGWWGRILSRTLRDPASIWRLARAVEPDANRAREAGPELSVPIDARYEDALEDRAIEAVVLATPHSMHEAQAIAAARAGKHVFVEKPLGLTLASASHVVEACRAAGVTLGVGHERRFEPPQRDLRALAESGGLGTLMQVEANFSHDKFTALSADNWRLSAAEAPAGGMTATGIHLLDLAIALLGDPVSAYATSATLASNIANGDSLSVCVRFASGATATINVMLATPFISRFACYGSQGWVEIRDKAHVEAPQGWLLTHAAPGDAPRTRDYPIARPVLDNLNAFATAAAGRAPYPISHAAMLKTIAALEAVFKSAASGKVEEVSAVL
ncbi:MAG TPA: Gfo/Idh/MocA family oxidoreductase [Burkholderiales bacterium]|nr:Gfo/Idh/MocA family oxidoreductase [Burkholderiales bacterium]